MAGVASTMPVSAFASDAPCRPLMPVDAATEEARSCPSCALPRALLLAACAGPVRECQEFEDLKLLPDLWEEEPGASPSCVLPFVLPL